MYRLLSFLLLFYSSIVVAASNDRCGDDFQLNQITFIESAERWVVAEKALVTVSIDANLDQTGIGRLQDDIMAKLKALSSSTQWRITQNYRRQDQSGLESVHAEAQARLPESQLVGLRQQADKISKPGFKINVSGIEYRPTNAETEQVKRQVRNDLYEQVKTELDSINKMYPKQRYFVNQMIISEGDSAIGLQRQMQEVKLSSVALKQAGNSLVASRTPGVSQKIRLTASVVLGSKINN